MLVMPSLKEEIKEQQEIIKHQKYQIKKLQKDLYLMYTRLQEVDASLDQKPNEQV